MLTNTIDIENIKSPPKGKEEARGGGGLLSTEQHHFTYSERQDAFYVVRKHLSHRLKCHLTGYIILFGF